MVFVVERQTTKFLPTKQYRNVLGYGLVYRNHENVSTNWPKIHSSRKLYPPRNTRYTVLSDHELLSHKMKNVQAPYLRLRSL